MSKLVGHPYLRPGCVIEFMQGDQPQLAWVLEEQSGKYRVLTINKREMKLAAPRLLPWCGPCSDPAASRQEILDALNMHQEKRGEIQAALDVMEIWELAQGEVPQARIEWFAGLLWESPGPDKVAALGRAMLAAKAHFKFRPPEFEIYPAEKVEARLAEQAAERERARVTDAGQTLFRSLWEARSKGRSFDASETDRVDEDVLERLRTLLREQIAKSGDEESDKLWNVLKKGLPEHPHLPLLLAQTWGLVPPHHNHWLDEAGYAWGNDWSEEHREEITAIETALEADTTAVDGKEYISIDSATTRDIDDAFFMERKADGYRLSLALARPSALWSFGGELDRTVFSRGTSLYLPEGTAHMMPEELGTDAFSLLEGQKRPALVAEFEFDADGVLQQVTPELRWVRVKANITYETAEQAIAAGSDEHLAVARELAGKLYDRRLESGAVVIRKPEPQVSVDDPHGRPQVRIELKDASHEADLIISEFMILANSELPAWAHARGIPLLHRTQDIALPAEAKGEFCAPEEIFKVVKLLAAPAMEVQPRRHAALGVPSYAPLSSPIRRYTDLINSAQICSYLENGAPRLDREDIEALIAQISTRLGPVMQVQRFRPRYWKLLHLQQTRKELRPAVVVEENGPYPCLAMPELQINVRAPRKMLGDKLYPGQRFQISFGRVDPLNNEIKIAEALEE